MVETGHVQALVDILLHGSPETINVSVVRCDTARGIFQGLLGNIPEDAGVNVLFVSDEPMGQGDMTRVHKARAGVDWRLPNGAASHTIRTVLQQSAKEAPRFTWADAPL